MLQTLPKWTPDRIVFAVVILLLIAAGVWVFILSRQLSSARHAAKVQTVVVQRDNILNADSLRSAVEHRVQDSVRAVVANYKNQLNALRNEITKIRAQNVALRASYDTMSLDRPDF